MTAAIWIQAPRLLSRRVNPPNYAKVKEVLLGDEGPDEWELPPKPKGISWATYERWVAKYDAAEEVLDAQLVMAARLMKRL